jgi:hypothetical protein
MRLIILRRYVRETRAKCFGYHLLTALDLLCDRSDNYVLGLQDCTLHVSPLFLEVRKGGVHFVVLDSEATLTHGEDVIDKTSLLPDMDCADARSMCTHSSTAEAVSIFTDACLIN